MRIKLISFIISIVYFLESTGFNYLPGIAKNLKDSLRPMALANSWVSQAEPDRRYVVVKKDGAEHRIMGVTHIIVYPTEAVERFIEGSDSVIFENARMTPGSLADKISDLFYAIIRVIDKTKSLVTGRRSDQALHANKLLLNNKEIFGLDVFYKRQSPLILACIICVIGILVNFSIIILYSLNPEVISTIFRHSLQAFVMINVIFPVIVIFFIITDHKIISDFRNLVYATKLSYLPEIFGKLTLKTATVVGTGHRDGIREYLEDDRAKEKKWIRYANSWLLRFLLGYFLDIEKSMEIQKWKGQKGKWTTIGTIAELPGPRELIAKLEHSSAKSDYQTADKAAEQTNLVQVRPLPVPKKELNQAVFNAIISAA